VDVVVGYAQDADGELSEDLGASLVVLALGRVIVDTTVELETMRALSLSDGLNRTLGIRRRNSGATGPIPH
jgi:hypothetical protein